MPAPKVVAWQEIADDFRDGGLVLGNGASIAFDPRFAYTSLKGAAEATGLITKDVLAVFEHLKTTDFEFVLRILWHAKKVNESLGIDEPRTTAAYDDVRSALIRAVRDVHVDFGEVQEVLPIAASFMARFRTVFSLNYDLLVYWALLVGNSEAPYKFKDCFIHGEFEHGWRKFRRPYGGVSDPTLVFYPHGNLALGADLAGVESKIHSGEWSSLLDTIILRWEREEVAPVFVSEGLSEQKQRSISRSPYLSTVLEEALPDIGDAVTIFGWSMSDADDHLLEALCSMRPRTFALSAMRDSSTLAEHCARVERKIHVFVQRPCEIVFFDASSKGSWIAS